MTKELANFLNNCCEHSDCNSDIVDDYSGRGMFGRTTHAIVMDSQMELLQSVLNYFHGRISNCDNETDKVYTGKEVPDITTLRVDNMGKRIVVY